MGCGAKYRGENAISRFCGQVGIALGTGQLSRFKDSAKPWSFATHCSRDPSQSPPPPAYSLHLLYLSEHRVTSHCQNSKAKQRRRWIYSLSGSTPSAPPLSLSGNCCRADIVKSGQSAGNFLAEEEGRFQMPEHGTPTHHASYLSAKKKHFLFSITQMEWVFTTDTA